MEHSSNDQDRYTLLCSLIDRQKKMIDMQNHRMMGYLAIIDYISTLARSKDISIPMDNVLALIEAKTDEERKDLLLSYKKIIVQDVIDSCCEEWEANAPNAQPDFNPDDSWNSPEWDDGVYAPPPDRETDITKWKVFDRQWRLFGNGKED